jgi:hypothetical protein
MGSKPQILQGAAEEYLSQIHLGQAKAQWFHSLNYDQLVNPSKKFRIVRSGPFCQSGKYLTIRVLNLKIICVDLTLGGI